MEKQDPSQQAFQTFGDSPAARRLKVEIDNGLPAKSAIRILNQGGEHANDLIYINPKSRKYFLHLLRTSVDTNLANCSADPLIKSLARNVFAKKIRLMLKMKGA